MPRRVRPAVDQSQRLRAVALRELRESLSRVSLPELNLEDYGGAPDRSEFDCPGVAWLVKAKLAAAGQTNGCCQPPALLRDCRHDLDSISAE
jgi:hypothetical protein